MGIQFCGTCGHPLIPNQLFCQHCGERVDDNATRAASLVEGSARATPGPTRYCGECGAFVGGQDPVCRRCGAPVEPAQRPAIDQSMSDAPTVRWTPPPSSGVQSNLYPGPPPGWASDYGHPQQTKLPGEPATFTTNVLLHPRTPPSSSAGRYGLSSPAQGSHSPLGLPPQKPPQPHWPLALAIILGVLAILVGSGGFLLLQHPDNHSQASKPTNTPGSTQATTLPGPTQVGLNEQTASDLIRQFYDDINNQRYDDAYDLFSKNYQQTQQSRQDFKDGFKTTIHDSILIDSTQRQPDGSVRVNVTLTAVDRKDGTDITTIYKGYYIVIKEDGLLRIDSGHLDPQ